MNCEIHTKHINTRCGQTQNDVILQQVVHFLSTGF